MAPARPVHPAVTRLRTAWTLPPVRAAALLLLVGVTAAICLQTRIGTSGTATVCPVAAIITGLLITTPRRLHAVTTLAATLVLVAARLGHGIDVVTSVGFAVSVVVGAGLAAYLLTGRGTLRPALLLEGDVSRMIGAVAAGAALTAGGFALTGTLAPEGAPLLAAVNVLGTQTAASLVLLPLFLRTPGYPALAGAGERALQTAILLGTTILVFVVDAPVFFAVIPMFSWLAFRGTLRQSTLLLATVAAVAVGLTLSGVGPIAALGERYDLAPELVNGVLQLFLIDAAIILLPLTAMMTQQRISSAEATRRQQALERIVSSSTQTVIITTDLEGRVQLFNPGAESMLGYDAAAALGLSMDHFVTAEELRLLAGELGTEPTFAAVAAGVVETDQPQRLWRVTRADGQQRTMVMTLSTVEDEDGRAAGFLATAEDVTEREAAQQALLETLDHQRRAVEGLRELDQVKNDFVATVSHELRTPITNIMGYVEVLQDGLFGDLSEQQHSIVSRVERNGLRLQTLIEDLLLLSHIERNGLTIKPVPVDLCQVVRAAQGEIDAMLVGRELDVSIQLPDARVEHLADPDKISRVVVHLMSNAVKFTPDGGRVTLLLAPRVGLSEISVIDSGVGIPEEEQDRMFSRFFRASTSMTDAVPGTGLGLTIVQSIVGQHGGELTVTSGRDRGTTVTAVLPRDVPPRPGAATQPATP